MLAAFSNMVISCGVDGEGSVWEADERVGESLWGPLIQRSSYKQINGHNSAAVGSSLNRPHVEIACCALKSSGPVKEAEVGKSVSLVGSGPTVLGWLWPHHFVAV